MCGLVGVNEVLIGFSFVCGFVSKRLNCVERWYVGDPLNETMGRISTLGLCRLGRPNSLGGCGTPYLSL